MTRKAAVFVIAYAETQNVSVQLTFEEGSWTAHFKDSVHAAVCFEEMKDKRLAVNRTSVSNGHLVKLW